MDHEQIRDVIRDRYAAVAAQPAGQFQYPIGRDSAELLGYRADFIGRIPPEVIRLFVGVGNPFSLGEPEAGSRVVDVGCGGGFDSQVAAHHVGPTGHVIGVDMSPEMLAVARAGLSASSLRNVAFVEGHAEALPVESGWADLVISNGVLNLAACKVSAFSEIARVLRPGGRFQAADLILVKDLPEDLRNDRFAWSN
jgi:SAM-dependent methyltransferase